MLKIFIGLDRRQPLAANVLQHSLNRFSSEPLQITQLYRNQLPVQRKGLTEFTYTRYLVPWLCDFEGTALFLDADMLCLHDIAELFALKDRNAVQVAEVADFERPSLMLFDCAQCTDLTPEAIESGAPQGFGWAGGKVGTLPAEWNHILGYSEPSDDAKLVHYTAGIPYWSEVQSFGYTVEWWQMYHEMLSTPSWLELMGQSVHAEMVIKQIQAQWQAWKQTP